MTADRISHLLDLQCRTPMATWQLPNGECRIERRDPKRQMLAPDFEFPRPYRLHWARMRKDRFERESRDFADLDELYAYAEQQGIAPNGVQMGLGI